MYDFGGAYRNKTVLVTGHTGFKGSWLCEWLLMLGARVVGYSLDTPTVPSHYEALNIRERIASDVRGDVCSFDSLSEQLRQWEPDFVFHLAAQSLVGESYDDPFETFRTNCLGSLNVLEAIRLLRLPCIVIMVTTDKVYENREWVHAYREIDPLGGHDPYSASKACAEILTSSYIRSFFNAWQQSDDLSQAAVATVRGGNVLGGGDWSADRIVPDCVRSLVAGAVIPVRNPDARRPWQHVVELIGAYLHLASEMSLAREGANAARLKDLCSAFNFGPGVTSNRTVRDLVQEILVHWPGSWKDISSDSARHEAGNLNLAIDKAYRILAWEPRWTFPETVKHTLEWYREYYRHSEPDPCTTQRLTQQQILHYAAQLSASGQPG